MTKRIIGIWAQDQTGLIGKDQIMPWHLPADLQHFKETTTGHAILMGRVTFDGMKGRVLPNRTSIVLTRELDYQVENSQVLVFHQIEEVLNWYQKQEKNLYIIGGAKILSAFEPYLQSLVVTDIHATFEGDTYFPSDFDWTAFEEVVSREFLKDEKNAYDFTVRELERKR